MDERRRFERIKIPETAKVFCEDRLGKRLGKVTVLGRGGLELQTQEHFREGGIQQLLLVDEDQDIHRRIAMVVRYILPQTVGFEFSNLEPEAAVEIGVIIGKHYMAEGKAE